MDLLYTKENYHQRYKKYKALVLKVTRKQPLYQLVNYDKRGRFKYHLDHIISIKFGFNNNIDPEIIGHISNLQYIPYIDNIKKRDYLTDDSFDTIQYLIENGTL